MNIGYIPTLSLFLSLFTILCHSGVLLRGQSNSSEELYRQLEEFVRLPHVYIRVAPSTISLFWGVIQVSL